MIKKQLMSEQDMDSAPFMPFMRLPEKDAVSVATNLMLKYSIKIRVKNPDIV